jgi:hypothetical protein
MQKYLLSIYQPAGDEMPSPSFLEKVMRDVNALRREMQEAGAWVFSGGLHSPSSATVLRVQDNSVMTTDGPFLEAKEHIGGFNIIKAADLDVALEWGRKLAKATTLPVEVRPFREGNDG